MNCEKCNSEMIYTHKGHSCNWSCPSCGWGIATSYFSPMEVDITIYTLFITKNTSPTIDMIKCVSKLLTCNFVKAKDTLEQGNGACQGRSTYIKEVAEKLTHLGLHYHIEPEFPYPLTPLVSST